MNESFLGLSPTAWIALFTVGILLAAVVQACIYLEMHSANKEISRAYVAFSPGVDERANAEGVQELQLFGQVINWGETPADVEDVVMSYHIGVRPLTIKAESLRRLRAEPTRAFLMKTGKVYLAERVEISEPDWRDIQAREQILWAIGYVDYVDRFNQRRRAGYAKEYLGNSDPRRGGNEGNLIFEPTPGYNYDKPRS